MEMLFQTFVNGIMSAMILILIASGLCLIFGILHIVNFAHGEFYMLGGFGAWLLFSQYPMAFLGSGPVQYFAAIALSMLVVGLLGVIVEKFIFRPFHGDLEATIIVAFGLMLIFQAGALGVFGVTDKAISSPFVGKLSLGGVSISSERLVAIVCGAIFITAMHIFISKSKLGKAMRAVAQDQEAAQVQGINIGFIFSLSMGIGCALAAAGGALVGPIYYVNPYMGVVPIMKAFVVIILGGIGSLPGAVIGGFIIAMTESLVTTYVGAHAATIVVFLFLIAVLLIKPSGIFGHAE